MPAGLDEHHPSVRRETGERDGLPPIPGGVTDLLLLRCGAVLNRVINDQHIDRASGERTADADAVDTSPGWCLPPPGGSGVLADADVQAAACAVALTVRCHRPARVQLHVLLDVTAPPERHVLLVADDGHAHRRVVVE